MSVPTNTAVVEHLAFIGVHDTMRHSIASNEPLHEYPDGAKWAFARCRRPACEPPDGCASAVRRRPMCDECASLEAEEHAEGNS